MTDSTQTYDVHPGSPYALLLSLQAALFDLVERERVVGRTFLDLGSETMSTAAFRAAIEAARAKQSEIAELQRRIAVQKGDGQ